MMFKNIFYSNIIVVILYWGISYINWLIFSNVGVLPMPLWPAASVAIVAAIYKGWYVAPGIAIGTVLANYFILEASFVYALCISVMNTLGPVFGAFLIKKRITVDLKVKSFNDFFIVLLIALVLVPFMTSVGGVGSKYLLGLLPANKIIVSLARWGIAHSFGTLLFALPYLIWFNERKKDEMEE